jgi:hypothetical protein
MSPKRYLWLRRMHFARRALRMADAEMTTDRHRDRHQLRFLGAGTLRSGVSFAVQGAALDRAASAARRCNTWGKRRVALAIC